MKSPTQMTHQPLEPEDEIKAGDEFLIATRWTRLATGWTICPKSFFGYKPCDFLPARFRRPTPDQPQKATETPTPETDKASNEISKHPTYAGDILFRLARSLELRLQAQTARADRLAVALANMREVYGAPFHESFKSLHRSKEDFERALAVDQAALSALASQGPTLALAQENARLKNERIAWEETAAQFHRNTEFYHNLIRQIGNQFGEAAKTADDGGIHEDVLALKVPELVAALAERVKELEAGFPPAHIIAEHSRLIDEREAAQAEVTRLKKEHDKVLSILPECRLWAEYARRNAHRDSFERIDKLIAVLSALYATPTEPAKE